MEMQRRWYAILGIACAVVAAGVAAGIVLFSSGTSAAAPPTKKVYLARVAAICRAYGPKLDHIIPPDIAEPANVIEAMKKVLPLIKGETDAVKALTPPTALRAKMRRWIDLHDRRIAKLEEALDAAKKIDLRTMSVAYVDFILKGPTAAKVGGAIGIPSPPC
jgi:hypothetical protein